MLSTCSDTQKMIASFSVEYEKYDIQASKLFSYLQETASTGLNPTQFLIYRDNFFFRTMHTIPSIAKVVSAAAMNGDAETLAEAGRNVFDETGSGNAKKAHSVLLEQSHNMHGRRIFHLPEIRLIESSHSPYLLREAIAFQNIQANLYSHISYPVVLATSFAQETAASSMLQKFYDTIFLPYKGHYSCKEFEDISEYFDCHLNGLEEIHAENARQSVIRACRDKSDSDAAITAISSFLKAQSDLWIAMLEAISKHESDERIVSVK